MPDIVVIGDINVDVIFTIPAYPLPGNEALASSVQLHGGGSAVNTAIALANMDMNVGFIGRVGKDPLANQVLDDLKNAGVDCSQVQVDPSVNTGMIFIAVTEDGERTMFGARGANSFTQTAEIDPGYFNSCRWIHLSSYSFLAHHQYETVLAALDIAENSLYTRVSMDIGTEPAVRAKSRILELLPRIDVILPNETEVILMGQGQSLHESLDNLLKQTSSTAIVTKRGSKGSLLAVGDKRIEFPAFDVQTKDTTGAGDNFNAGVVLGRLVGLSWEASTALGNALGGLATTRTGAAAAFLNRNDVARLIDQHLFAQEWAPMRIALEELTAYFEGVL
ncbi:MAG: carbohydrate kinase family protein [Chloroflexi bacterium]|nr:MAG: carbohydrate kinase family protein [Chloroflexota bacterium]